MEIIKKTLIEILDFYRYKIDNDKCTSEDMEAAFELLRDNAVSEATIKDIADFYRQSESNVRNVVTRKAVPKKRILVYDFKNIASLIPDKWRNRKGE